jgi:hypothetical protein
MKIITFCIRFCIRPPKPITVLILNSDNTFPLKNFNDKAVGI